MSNLVTRLQKIATKQKGKTALIFLDDCGQETAKITYSELDKKARVVAAFLQKKANMGERVLLVYPSGLEFITAFLGCLYAGIIGLPVFIAESGQSEKIVSDIIPIINDAKISGILTVEMKVKEIDLILSRNFLKDKIFLSSNNNDDFSPNDYQPPPIDQETIAYLQYTSGSTNAPKLVVISHKNLIHNIKYSAKSWEYSSKNISLIWTSHAHVFGLVCGILLPIYYASCSIILQTEDFLKNPILWFKAITQYKVTHSGCPNFGYEHCIKRIGTDHLDNINLSSWKVAINGGENISATTLLSFYKKFKRVGFKLSHFCSAYGMSEAAGTISATPYGKKPFILGVDADQLMTNNLVSKCNRKEQTHLVSSGKILPGLEVIIVDPVKRIALVKGKVGEIWISGKSIMQGYWQDNILEEDSFTQLPGCRKSFFRTGDIGFKFKNELFVIGRIKDIIIKYGKKYNVLKLERTIYEAISDITTGSVVIFSIEKENQQDIILLIEITDVIADKWQLYDRCRITLLERYGLDLYEICLVKENSLPRTLSGKLARTICRTQYLQKKIKIISNHVINKTNLSTSNQVDFFDINYSFYNELQNDFKKLIARCLNIGIENIDLSASVSSYGLDSIKIVELSGQIKDFFNITITPDKFYSYSIFLDFIKDLCQENSSKLFAYYAKHETNILSKDAEHKNNYCIENSKSYKDTDVAIIGFHGIFPGANDLDIFWDNLIQQKEVITLVPKERWHSKISAEEWGGFINEIANFDASFFNISPREAELIDPQQRIFLQTVWKTIEHAGYAISSLATEKVGVYVGVFSNDYAELLYKHNITDPYTTTGTARSILANRISYLFNFHGPSETIDTACSSSLVAVHHALLAMHHGDCDVAIVGGVNALLSPASYEAASKAGMLSHEGRCKTFDKEANGYVRSEGAGAILLKRLGQANRDGDTIYGIIKGSAVNHGGQVSSLTVPNPNAQAEVIISACQRAGVEINSINYIEAHGTGTSLGDPIEINGLKNAFLTLAKQTNKKLKDHYCGIGSVKSHIGHLEAAAGIASLIKILLSIKHKQLPGNMHFKELNPYIDLSESPFYIVHENVDWLPIKDQDISYPLRAGISSFGFGGTNAHLIIEEFPPVQFHIENSEIPYLITLSAKTESSLHRQINDLYQFLLKQLTLPSLSAISYTLNIGREHFNRRCALVVTNVEELKETLKTVIAKQATKNIFLSKEINKNELSPIFQDLCASLTAEIEQGDLVDHEKIKKLLVLANFYIDGYHLDFERLHKGEKTRIGLPTYSFSNEYYWFSSEPVKIHESKKTSHFKDNFESIEADLVEIISSKLKIDSDRILKSRNLNELGIESIAIKDLTLEFENKYNIEISPAIFYSNNSIKSLGKYIQSKLSNFTSIPNRSIDSSQVRMDEKDDAIAIIGMQGYLPASNSLSVFWEHLINGTDLITEVPTERWDWHEYFGDPKENRCKTDSKWGGFIEDVDKFDAAFFNISAREANLMDPQHRLMLEVVWKLIEDAGYNPLDLSGEEVGLFIGAEFNDYQTLIAKQSEINHGHVSTGNSHALIANRISYFLNLHGPSEVISTACSSGLVAVHRGINAIRNGECNLAVAGAVSLMLSPDTFVITSQLGALSPDGRCKTFDQSANGYVKGEAVVAVLLKRLSLAVAESDHIYGIIRASSVNHGGRTQSLTAPNASTQETLLIKTYQRAGIDPKTITYIETHGTGTELGDPIEVEGLKLAFDSLMDGQRNHNLTSFCGLGSIKTNMGHSEPASGIVGLIKILLSMRYGVIPRNLHFKKLNSFIKLADSPFYLINENQEWKHLIDENGSVIPRRAGLSSFGFGGTCAHLIVEEFFQSENEKLKLTPQYFLIPLSAKQSESLKQKIKDLHDWLVQHLSDIDLESLSYTLSVGRSHFEYRSALIVKDQTDLIVTLKKLINNEESENYIEGKIEGKTIDSNISYPSIELDEIPYRQALDNLAAYYVKGGVVNWTQLYRKNKRLASLPTYPFIKKRYWFDIEAVINAQQKDIDPLPSIDSANIEELTCTYLQTVFANKLRLASDQISIYDTYEIYGIDSILTLEITTCLEQDFGSLPKTLLYEKNTIYDLSQYLLLKYHSILERMFFLSLDSITSKTKISEKISLENIHTNTLNQDIAVIGVHINFPMACNMQELWEKLTTGSDCISIIPKDRWDYAEHPIKQGDKENYYKFGGFISDIDKFDPLFFNISPREAMLMDPQERLFLQSAWAAIEDAGYTRERISKLLNNNVGVFAGVTYNFYPLLIQEEWQKGNKLPLDIQQFSIANRVSYFLNLSGPSYVVDTACSSSLSALHLACESIKRGECLAALAGGVNLSVHPAKYHFLGGYGFLSETGRCQSFAQGGDGYVPSEGVGCFLLKPLELALKDKDPVYGVIKSSSMNHGGKTSGYTVPSPSAQAELIKSALQKAAINPRTITYIEAHGTGTSLGDPIEIRGLQEAFETYTQDKQFCSIGSVKSNLGHLESAAGVSQLAKVLLQLKYKTLVPSIHSSILNPYIDFENSPFYVQQTLEKWEVFDIPRRAGVSSFGAGGTNVHLIVEEFNTNYVEYAENIPATYIFVLSALNKDRLQEYSVQILAFLEAGLKSYQDAELALWLQDVCYTLQIGRESMATRLAILTNDLAELILLLKNFIFDPSYKHDHLWYSENASNKISPSQKQVTLELNATKYIEAWINGSQVDWKGLYTKKTPSIISLPTYPFAKRRCWVTPEKSKERIADSPVSQTNSIDPDWLLFNDKEIGFHLKNNLKCVHCFLQDEFLCLDEDTFYLSKDRSGDLDLLFDKLVQCQFHSGGIKGIIYLWHLIENNPTVHTDFLLNLIQHLGNLEQNTDVIIVTRGLNLSESNISDHHWVAIKELFSNEIGNKITLFLLDLNAKTESLSIESQRILTEINNRKSTENLISYADNKRFVRAYSKDLPAEVDEKTISQDEVFDLLLLTMSKLLELEVSEIDMDIPFLNYGMDSILGINFIAQLEKYFNNVLSPMDLYRYPTVNQLGSYLSKFAIETPTKAVVTKREDDFLEENQFLNSISHLSESEVASLLEQELNDIELLYN